MKLVKYFVILTLLVTSAALTVCAQQGSSNAVTDKDLELLRKDLRSGKKQLVAANMQLTDKEAEQFWPIYDQYMTESTRLYDTRYGIIKDYAANIQNLTDVQAASLAKRWSDTDVATVQLRQRYFPNFEKAIGGKKAARFFQIDRRLALMIDLQLASEIPLVQP